MALRISGNRLLKTPPGLESRPTLGRVRQALFNIWRGDVVNCRWLDLCAGSGSMGAEALCEGAAAVIGIEQSPSACRIIRENWQRLARSDQRVQVLQGDVLRLLPTLMAQMGAVGAFDRIYFDPPYESDLYAPVLEAIASWNVLDPQGEIAVEHDVGRSLLWPVGLQQVRVKRYGRVQLSFAQRSFESVSSGMMHP